jgi:putative membrane protein
MMNKIIIEEKRVKPRNYLLEWLIRMIGYTLVLIIVSMIFDDTVYIDSNHFWLWGFLAVVIIDILNMFIKPILVVLTLPITILTLGLFYPLINVIILYIADFILMDHFEIGNFFMAFIVALVISMMNGIMDRIVFNHKRGEI